MSAPLPPIPIVRARSKAMAALDAILMPDWQYRHYSFNSRWKPNESMASMRNGSGDHYFILFNPQGAIIKGFAHESHAADHVARLGKPLPGLLDNIPPDFASFVAEPAFTLDETTFCLWRTGADAEWHSGNPGPLPGPDPTGELSLLALLRDGADAYARWAEDYYEQHVNIEAVRRMLRQEPIDQAVVQSLNPKATLAQVRDDLEEIGYPIVVNP